MTVGTGDQALAGAMTLTAGQSTGASGGDGGAMTLTAGESTAGQQGRR
jgi:hypothetical protein